MFPFLPNSSCFLPTPYLENSLKQAKSASQKERLQMLWWLKTGQVSEHQELSKRLGRSPASITRWLSQ
jgi:hypothetical protein